MEWNGKKKSQMESQMESQWNGITVEEITMEKNV